MAFSPGILITRWGEDNFNVILFGGKENRNLLAHCNSSRDCKIYKRIHRQLTIFKKERDVAIYNIIIIYL